MYDCTICFAYKKRIEIYRGVRSSFELCFSQETRRYNICLWIYLFPSGHLYARIFCIKVQLKLPLVLPSFCVPVNFALSATMYQCKSESGREGNNVETIVFKARFLKVKLCNKVNNPVFKHIPSHSWHMLAFLSCNFLKRLTASSYQKKKLLCRLNYSWHQRNVTHTWFGREWLL